MLPPPKAILLVALGIVTASFCGAWMWDLFRQRKRLNPTLFQALVGFVTCFFDTLGIGSYATTTALYRLRRTVPGLSDPWLHEVEVWHGDQHVVIRRGSHVVAANLAGTPQTVSVRSLPTSVLLATSPGVVVERDRLVLPAETAAVVAVR